MSSRVRLVEDMIEVGLSACLYIMISIPPTYFDSKKKVLILQGYCAEIFTMKTMTNSTFSTLALTPVLVVGS